MKDTKKEWEKIEREEIKKCKGTTFEQACDADHFLSRLTEKQEDELDDRLNNVFKRIREKRQKEKSETKKK